MAGKHRGPSRKGKTNRLTRLTLDADVEQKFLRLVRDEQRSMANMLSVLVTEAILARKSRK